MIRQVFIVSPPLWLCECFVGQFVTQRKSSTGDYTSEVLIEWDDVLSEEHAVFIAAPVLT